MSSCEEISSRINLWLDGELQADEITLLESHHNTCTPCRNRLENERRFLATVRAATAPPLASPELRASVEKLLADNSIPLAAPPRLRRRIARAVNEFGLTQSNGLASRRWITQVALLTLAFGLLIAAIWLVRNQSDQSVAGGPSAFAMMAADTHRRFLQQQLPLEISSQMPEQISAWFVGKVPFSVKLPDYQEHSGQMKLYSLEGARLVGYRNDYAAYVAYRMHQRPISLVVTSNSIAQPAGGEEIVSQNLTFHFNSIHGFKVITWSDRGLTYALVSDLEERGQESCVVCHQGAKDRDLIEKLKPRP